jgi:hypothetical protein
MNVKFSLGILSVDWSEYCNRSYRNSLVAGLELVHQLVNAVMMCVALKIWEWAARL